jgi:hypothetical protein
MKTILALPSDTHCGSTLGLHPPKPFQKHEGGEYVPSKAQRIIWNQWEHNWDIIRNERKGANLIIVHDGDIVEGVHHDTTQITTVRVDEQETVASLCMDFAMQKAKFGKGDKYFQMAGTEEHAGNGSSSEERVARDLDGVVPVYEQTVFDEDGMHKNGRYTWDGLLRTTNGVLFDIAHHGGTIGNSALTTENGLRNKIKSIYWECLELGLPIPRYWIRAHFHTYVRVDYEGRHGVITGIMLPGFQIKTGYVYKKRGFVMKPADVGMVWIVINDDGSTKDYIDKIEVRQEEIKEF